MQFGHVRPLLHSGWCWSLEFLSRGRWGPLVCGGLAGLALVTICHQFTAALGTGLPAVTGLAIAIAVGFELGRRPVRRHDEDAARRLLSFGLLHFAVAAWIAALPWLIEAAMAIVAGVPAETLALPGRAAALLALIASAVVSPAVFWLSRLPASLSGRLRIGAAESNSRGVEAPGAANGYLAGIVVGVLFDVFVVAPLAGIHAGGMLAAAGGGTVFLVSIARFSRTGSTGAEAAERLSENGDSHPSSWDHMPRQPQCPGASPRFRTAAETACVEDSLRESNPESANVTAASGHRDQSRSIAVWLAVGCVGALVAVALRMTQQLAPSGSYLVHVQWAAILAGVAAGTCRAQRRLTRGGSHGARACLAAAAWAALILAMFPWMIEASLALNAFVANVSLMMAGRSLLAAAVVLPFGIGWGGLALFGQAGRADDAEQSGLPSLRPFALVAGFLAARWIGFAAVGVPELLAGAAWLLAILSGALWLNHRARLCDTPVGNALCGVPGRPDRIAAPGDSAERRGALAPRVQVGLAERVLHRAERHRGRSLQASRLRLWCARGIGCAAVGVVVAAPFVRHRYEPVRAARQLFATNVFVARQHGLEPELLSFLDDGRQIASIEGERGTYTLWRYLGTQLQVRESGVPKAIVSTRPRICPHFTAELMQAVLPLVLHEHPHRVLVLGLGGGVPLTTCLGFPVQQLTCVEGDRGLIELLERHVWSESGETPFSDDRVRLVELDPVLAVASKGGEYDVIVSSPDSSALLHATPHFTRAFYKRAAERLTDEGIFCQRFHQVDYGPRPLAVVARTMQAAFSDVAAVEIATGEVALLGTNSPRGLFRAGLVERFQAPHVRQALSQVGWDWSVPLNLPAYDNQGLGRFAGELSAGINTCANGRFAFRLPQEVIRWGAKWQETYAVLAKHQGRVVQWGEAESIDPGLLRRLSEVTGQRELMTAFPDQPWAYRKELRKQLTERPRTLIQTVSGDDAQGSVHAEDRRRMRYFTVLAEAAKSRSADDIRRIAMFETPYDPLLSYFVHHEAAALMAGSPERDVATELRHRLHTVYFAQSQDRSVRNVATALRLLCEHPESLERPLDRWDHLNALLQVMKTRWETRGLVQPKSARLVLNDIEKSLSAIEAALAAMDGLQAELGLAEDDWQSRRTVVEQSLAGPLRTYRSVLLKHHLQERHQSRELLKRAELQDASDSRADETQ